jgi:Putative prokaryotic signal transducing protein
MSECPTCGRRLRGNICPYCDEEVIESGEAEDVTVSGEGLVEVFRSRTQAQADFVTSLLESEGIPTFQAPGGSSDSGKGRGISIQVEEEDGDRAKDVIESAKDDLDTADN